MGLRVPFCLKAHAVGKYPPFTLLKHRHSSISRGLIRSVFTTKSERMTDLLPFYRYRSGGLFPFGAALGKCFLSARLISKGVVAAAVLEPPVNGKPHDLTPHGGCSSDVSLVDGRSGENSGWLRPSCPRHDLFSPLPSASPCPCSPGWPEGAVSARPDSSDAVVAVDRYSSTFSAAFRFSSWN